MNRNLVGNIYGMSPIKIAHIVSIHLQTFPLVAILVSEWSNFRSPCQRQCEFFPLLGVRRPSSVNFSHFNLLLWNPSAKWSETWQEVSMEGPP